MTTYKLPCFGITVTCNSETGNGQIESLLKETCPICGKIDCYINCGREPRDVTGRLQYNAAIDGIESLLLAMACIGVDLNDLKIIEAIETAVDACSNNF